MSSSISSSEPPPGIQGPWRRFALTSLATLAGAGLLLSAALLALDPYDTGILALVDKPGIVTKSPRLGGMSRMRDEGFNAAIFGNSHILPVDPARLSAATGLVFVTLAVPGTGVPEQMTMLDAYLARHTSPAALVIAVDWLYCLADPRGQLPQPFPGWLYAPDRLTYATHLIRFGTFKAAWLRLLYLAGLRHPQTRDGAMDIYEGHRRTPAEAAALLAEQPREDYSGETTMPGFAMLAERLARTAPETRVVLVLPPVAASFLPLPGTAAAASLATCKAKAEVLASVRPNTTMVDWHRAWPGSTDPAHFWDATHYYDEVAVALERDIAAALQRLASVRQPPSGAASGAPDR